jgi:hypothetical protein
MRYRSHGTNSLRLSPSPFALDAFEVGDGAQPVVDLHEVGLIAHDLLHVLIGLRRLVEQRFGITVLPLDAHHASLELGERNLLPRARPRHRATGAVRAALVGRGVAEPGDDERRLPHRPGDETAVAATGADRTLAGDVQRLAQLTDGLERGVVVVAVDLVLDEDVLAEEGLDGAVRAREQLPPVLQRVRLDQKRSSTYASNSGVSFGIQARSRLGATVPVKVLATLP